MLAIDRDMGENGRVTYSIKSGKGKAKFRINADTGVIYAAKPFEADAEYEILVRAEDNGLPKKSGTTLVSVFVVDAPTSKENINPPQIKNSDQRVEVTENDSPGFLVTLIQAYDEDNDQLWFDIIGMLLFAFILYCLVHHQFSGRETQKFVFHSPLFGTIFQNVASCVIFVEKKSFYFCYLK